jgi:hypothetical protein
MKHLSIFAATCALLFCTAAQQATAGGTQTPATEEVRELEAPLAKKKIKPGEDGCNQDGVCVDNSDESSGNAYIDPAEGSTSSDTTVTTQSGFEGEITGLDGTDSANLGSNNTATVTGTGGDVSLGGGSTVTVNNSGGTGSSDITVTLPSGTEVTVPPGSTGIKFTT